MKRDIKRFEDTQYDCLIIGGGINGAAIAHMAALNGLKTALLEKGDFASGTSSKSTKIVHGGLRYLENLEFDLVREALRERFVQLANAPHLITPMGFVIPVYKTDARPLWMMKLGVFLYDLLSGKYIINRRRTLTAKEVIHLVEGINQEGLVGGVMYYDGQMDDARLCLENVLSAESHGAHVANYVEVKELIKENGKAVGVVCHDSLNDYTFRVAAKKIVCAVGPWTDLFKKKERSQSPQRVRTTKGVHIVYKGKVCDHALLIPTAKGKRIFFIIPFQGNSLIGTTDTDFSGNPDDVKTEQVDINYLFDEAKRVFPDIELSKEDIITTFAGLRPLVFKEGAPSKISRKHVIEQSYSNVIYVIGGKYTTYRKIAENTVKKLTKKTLVDTSSKFPLYGSGPVPKTPDTIANQYGLDEDIVLNLFQTYGTRYKDVLKLMESDDSLRKRIFEGSPKVKAQIVYAAQTEMAVTEEDVIRRRLNLEFDDCPPDNYEPIVRNLLNYK